MSTDQSKSMEARENEKIMRNAMVLFARGDFRTPDLELVAAYSGLKPEDLRGRFATARDLMHSTYTHWKRASRGGRGRTGRAFPVNPTAHVDARPGAALLKSPGNEKNKK